MILRLVRATLLPGRLEAFLAGLERGIFPEVTTTPGLVRAHVARRTSDDADEVLFMTVWESAEAEMQRIGNVERMLPIDDVSEHLAVDSIGHFEVDAFTVQESVGEPAVIRTATGWIEMGPDVEIQQELRRRLPTLGSELVEAYVGRRMRGRTVEVLLVAAWSEAPEGISLLEPLWPDITARYHSFTVETWEPLRPRQAVG